MCACEPSYVCSKCAGTPQDWRVELDEPEPLTLDTFDYLNGLSERAKRVWL